jgi:uncharacterized membrane protein YvbJ
MVYCSRCGTLNPDSAAVCNKCGAPLSVSQVSEPQWSGRRDKYREYSRQQKRSSGIGALIAGIVILLIGLSFMFPGIINIGTWWYFLLIIIGIWLLYVGIRRSRRNT